MHNDNQSYLFQKQLWQAFQHHSYVWKGELVNVKQKKTCIQSNQYLPWGYFRM